MTRLPYDVMYFSKARWRIFLRHPNVLTVINAAKGSTVTTGTVTEAEVRAYMIDMGFPPVIVIDELSGLQTDGITANIVSWETANVVIAQAGPIGTVKNAKPISVQDPSIRTAFTEDGRIKIIEINDNKRVTQGFEAECLALPVLSRAKYLVIIDTSVTSTWT